MRGLDVDSVIIGTCKRCGKPLTVCFCTCGEIFKELEPYDVASNDTELVEVERREAGLFYLGRFYAGEVGVSLLTDSLRAWLLKAQEVYVLCSCGAGIGLVRSRFQFEDNLPHEGCCSVCHRPYKLKLY